MRPVLTDDERKSLALVPTTEEQARQILKRNTALLEALLHGKSYRGDIGCPHCQTAILALSNSCVSVCKVCAWNRARHRPASDDTCLAQSFGGYTFHDMRPALIFGPDDEDLDMAYVGDRENQMPREAIEAFLRGHIEWARAVLAGGFRPVVAGRKRRVRG